MAALVFVIQTSQAFVTYRSTSSLPFHPVHDVKEANLALRTRKYTGSWLPEEGQHRQWNSRRLSLTRLWDVVDQRDVEALITKVNGEHHDEYWFGGESSSQPRTLNGRTSTTIVGGIDLMELDVPQPTENGGYSHTSASRAKIGAANKGKVPWNKGRERSAEERNRIAAGVRARNREKFLRQLSEMGMTEEEYEEKKKEERRKKDAERRSRRTEKGGYRPTEETRAKISQILKDKHARGEITRRSVDPSKVRRGFNHSEETKQKIAEALRMRWSSDPEYRERMTTNMKEAYSKDEIRLKVSETLKKKWENPEFRQEMLEKMQKRRKSSPIASDEYRQKISNSMKKKWQDPEYRAKTIDSMFKSNAGGDSSVRERKPRTQGTSKPPSKATGGGGVGGPSSKSRGGIAATEVVRMIQPLAPGEGRKKPPPRPSSSSSSLGDGTSDSSTTGVIPRKRQAATASTRSTSSTSPDKNRIVPTSRHTAVSSENKPSLPKKQPEPDGSVNRLREERRDLFDLLYGDDVIDDDGIPSSSSSHRRRSGSDDDYDDTDSLHGVVNRESDSDRLFDSLSSRFDFGDEDLDTFDPYGLDDY